ncbi:MAG: oligosaccharide flippase family protein [Pedobacter sp.]
MSLKKNVIANFSGGVWSALMGIAFVPFYIRLMGAESYGLIGVFFSIQTMLAVLDLGLSQTLGREMARLSVDRKNAQLMVDTARTLEIIYWVVAIGVVALIAIFSDFIAYRWLNPELLSRKTLQEALWVVAIVVGLRWPVALYMGGLNGLQRQVDVNIISAVFATLQGAGAIAVLWYFEPTVRAFFMWQALIALLQVVVFKIVLWKNLRSDLNGKFYWPLLKNLWRFAAGMTATSLLSTVLMQMDKILLSKLLSLSEFGYYTFAASVAAVISRLVGPIFTAYYPRFVELVSKGDQPELIKTYHKGCQILAITIIPFTLTLAFFSKEVLQLWVRDSNIVEHSFLLVSLLVIGNALNGLMNMPYAIQLAFGWIRLGVYVNIFTVIVLAPAIYFSTLRWGAIGAAVVWMVLNSFYFIICIQIMHRHLLKTEMRRWYVNDVGKILVGSLIVTGISRIMIGTGYSDILKIIIILGVMGAATTIAAVSADSLRYGNKLIQYLRCRQ